MPLADYNYISEPGIADSKYTAGTTVASIPSAVREMVSGLRKVFGTSYLHGCSDSG